jgi:hypothetical protein
LAPGSRDDPFVSTPDIALGDWLSLVVGAGYRGGLSSTAGRSWMPPQANATERSATPSPATTGEVWLLFPVDAHLCATSEAPGRALVVGPGTLRHPNVRQPDGQRLADVAAGGSSHAAGDLVFVSDVAADLAASGEDFATIGLDWEGVLEAIVRLHGRGEVKALELGGLSAEELRLLAGWPPAISIVAREELRARLRRRVLRARQRWYHPSRRGFHPEDPFL